MDKEIYDLDELIEILEDIKNNGEGILNFPKAFYCLAKEIGEIKFYLQCLNDLIPLKYKKFNPKNGENPFFSKNDIHDSLNDPEERRKAKERMENLLKNTNKL